MEDTSIACDLLVITLLSDSEEWHHISNVLGIHSRTVRLNIYMKETKSNVLLYEKEAARY